MTPAITIRLTYTPGPAARWDAALTLRPDPPTKAEREKYERIAEAVRFTAEMETHDMDYDPCKL